MSSFARITVLLAALVLAVDAAPAAEGARVGGYDFAYVLGGDAPARPVQVFDDGQDTFLQFRSGAAIPAVFTVHAGVPQLLSPRQDGPYLRVPQLHGQLLLQLGATQATAIHARGERPDAPALTVRGVSGVSQPFRDEGVPTAARLAVPLAQTRASRREAAEDQRSYATPLQGDRVQWSEPTRAQEHAIVFARASQALSREAQQTLSRIVQRAAPGARYVVIGRDDDSDKEHLEQGRADVLRDALRRAGVAAERIELRTGGMRAAAHPRTWESTVLVQAPDAPRAPAMQPTPAPTPAQAATAAGFERPAGGFTLGVADRTIAGALRRWGEALGYQLVWDAPQELDAPITGAATVPGDSLRAALENLLRGLQEQGYRLEVTLHANNVIRVTPATQQPGQPQQAAPPSATKPARDGARPLLRAGAFPTS